MPTGGGSSSGFRPVSCYLRAANVNTKGAGSHPALWGSLFDNPWDTNALASIPAGLGLTFLFNGTDATITTTVAGAWNFTLVADTVLSAGSSWAAVIRDGMLAAETPPPLAGTASVVTVASQYVLPAAAVLIPECETQVAGDGVGTVLTAFHLVTVRLA